MDELIAAIRKRLKTHRTDLGPAPRTPLKRATPAGIAQDEKLLRFALPEAVKLLYAKIGNGGFGPGYGLIGLTGGVPDDSGKTAPVLYHDFLMASPEEPSWKWPRKLLPICHWGCAIYSCIDCGDPNFPMRIFDPNVHDGDTWKDAFFDEADSFEEWIGDWAEGEKLWDRLYGESGLVTRTVAARRTRP